MKEEGRERQRERETKRDREKQRETGERQTCTKEKKPPFTCT